MFELDRVVRTARLSEIRTDVKWETISFGFRRSPKSECSDFSISLYFFLSLISLCSYLPPFTTPSMFFNKCYCCLFRHFSTTSKILRIGSSNTYCCVFLAKENLRRIFWTFVVYYLILCTSTIIYMDFFTLTQQSNSTNLYKVDNTTFAIANKF